jgi:hypothetical protein
VELAGAEAALVDWADAIAAPAKVTAASEKAATIVASPSFVVACTDDFPFEVNIVVSPVMTCACCSLRRRFASCDSIHGSHGYVLIIDDMLNIPDA